MIPIVLFFYLFSFDLLNLWLGKEFALKSYEIVEILSIGIFFNALGMIPFALIQSTGRADITAKIHILELPVYILLLIVLVEEYHIVGVAIAWSIRTFLDALILYYFAIKQLRVTA
jgi:O-antigen/teichoic acid export membrane protein